MKIIILHGLYMHGIVMKPLSQQLRKLGYQTQVLSYNSIAIEERRVFSAIDHALAGDNVNILVGHSLGGLIIKHYLNARQPSHHQISHVVTIGSPLQGASIAEQLKKIGLGALLGNATVYGLNVHQDQWLLPQKLGSIAGNLALGLRPLLLGRELVSDGTVTVRETQIPGMTDHIETRNTHTSLLYRRDIARQIDHFVRHDRFAHARHHIASAPH